MFFNKEGQPSIIEVAKEQKKLPPNFPIDAFLEQYNAWNTTPNSSSYEDGKGGIRQSLFATLRDLHQQYGINSASTVFGSEEEMHIFAKYLYAVKSNQSSTSKALDSQKGISVSQQEGSSHNSGQGLRLPSGSKTSNITPVSPTIEPVKPVQEGTDASKVSDSDSPKEIKKTKKDTHTPTPDPVVDIPAPVITRTGPALTQSENPMFGTKQKIVSKDGRYYLTGPKGKTRQVDMQELMVNLNIPKEAPENLQKSVSLVQDFALLLDAYLLKNPNQKHQYDATLKGIEKDFASPDIQSGRSVLDIKKWTYTLFSNNNFLGDSDLYKINQAIDIKEPKARKLAILNFIRDRLGQSDMVAQKLMESVDIGIPSDSDLIGNKGDIGSNAEHRKKIADAIRHAETEATQDWEENHAEYETRFKQMNPGARWDSNEAKENNKKMRMILAGKKEFAYQELYNKKDLPGDQALLQTILGAGTWKTSDRSWEVSKEVAGMLAIEAIAIAAGTVSMGMGTGAINFLAFGRNAYRGAKALEAYNAASKTRQGITTVARILGSGIGFEAGGATARSLIENGDITSMHSKEGYVQSIAMMGVMSGIGKLISAGKLGMGIQFKEGAGWKQNIVPFTGQVVIEGSAIFGTSATIGSMVFDRRDNWTLEQMGQAMLMATVFKGAGRVMAYKDANGNVGVRSEAPTQPTSHRGARVEADTYAAELKYFKDYHITGDALYERVTRLGGSKKIEIEGLHGYTIGMTADRKMLHIIGPDKAGYKVHKDKLEEHLELFFNSQKKANPKVEIPAQPTDTATQPIATPRIETPTRPEPVIISREIPAQPASPDGPMEAQVSRSHHTAHVDAHLAHSISDDAAKTVNQIIAGWTDRKAMKFAWDLATKEMEPGGLIKSTLVFPANIMRLPAINTRKVMETWFQKGEKGFSAKDGDIFKQIGDSVKIVATASSKPFEGKAQSMYTVATMGTVLYMAYNEVQKANPNSPKDWTWGLTLSYLKNMNIVFPVEFTQWFFSKKDSIANWFDGK